MMISRQKCSLAVTVVKTRDEELGRALQEVDKTSNNSRLFIYTMTHQIATSVGSQRKQDSSRKASTLLTVLKSLTVWITTNWKILQEMGTPDPPYLPPEQPVCRSRSNS